MKPVLTRQQLLARKCRPITDERPFSESEIQAQLLENLNINAEIVVMESGAFLEAADAGTIEGLHLLGWGADYPDMTNFLDYHFGAGSSDQFGDHFPELTDVLTQAASLAGEIRKNPILRILSEALSH